MSLQELVKATESLKNAEALLHQALKDQPNNIELHKALRDAAIQRLEFCVELSWETSMKILGLQTRAPNPAIRDMAQNGLIDDTQVWFDFLKARNKTSHTYNEELAAEVHKVVAILIPNLESLISRLKKIK